MLHRYILMLIFKFIVILLMKILSIFNPGYFFVRCLTLSLTLAVSITCIGAAHVSYCSFTVSDYDFHADTLKTTHIDSMLLTTAAAEIRTGKYGEVHAMVVLKDDKFVFEEYYPGHQYKWDGPDFHGEMIKWDKSTLHGLKSVSKSITSLCIGIAIDKGFIKSVNQSVFDYLPDHQPLKTGGKEKITIEHLLTMTSGLEWVEWNTSLSSGKNDIVGIWLQEKDPVSFILEKPLLKEPGTTFNYSGGNTILLGEIIRHATNMDLEQFSREYLFNPLAIDSARWGLRYRNGVIEAGGGVEMTPRDLAKIGTLCLNKGIYNGVPVISGNWIQQCRTPYGNNSNIFIPGHFSGSHGYGYSWWLKSYKKSGKEYNMYHAVGWGGQELIIIPELNAVVVFTGGNYVPLITTFSILDKYILPAIN